MKKLYTLTLLALVTISAYSRPTDIVTTWWGNWSQASNWSLGRIPKNGDSVVVPLGYAIVFDVATSFTNLDITVNGNLTLQTTMTLDNQSTVTLAGGAQINAWGASRTTEIIVLDGVHKFDQTNTAKIWGAGLASTLSGVAPNGFTLASLPVVFSSFYATRNNDNVVLTWATEQESDNSNFEIQRSTDGTSWTVAAIVMGAGTSATAMQYSYTDKNVTAAVVYYRIRQVDFDGHYEYSVVKTVRNNEATPATKVYVANQQVNIEFNQPVSGDLTVRLFNANGQLLAQQNYGASQYKLSLGAAGKTTGVYIVQVSNNKGWSESARVLF